MSGFLTTEQLRPTVSAAKRPVGRAPLGKHNRTPRKGYNTPEEDEWRTRLWEQMVRHLTPSVRGIVDVFVIDTTEALEIEKVLRLGFTEEHLHVCNVNPAIVATLKRKYPAITTYGVEADEALRRAREQGVRFAAISLDLCGPISTRTHDILHAARAAVDFHGSVGLTMMRGREPEGITLDIPGTREERSWVTRLVRRFFKVRSQFDACAKTHSDVMRMGAPLFHLILGPCKWGKDSRGRTMIESETPPHEWCSAKIRGGGIYRSGVVTMMWLCFSVVQPISWRPVGWKPRTTDGWREEGMADAAAFRRESRGGNPAPPMRV